MRVYTLVALLTFLCWRISDLTDFTAADDIGYWIGVSGASMMGLLFGYPLRKYLSPLRSLGKLRTWFVLHMAMGVGGPLLIMIHANFRFGSLNSAVAMLSMLAVAISGLIGRFLYVRVNRGLHGERGNLAQLLVQSGFHQGELRSALFFAPEIEQILARHARDFQPQGRSALQQLVNLLALRWTQRRVREEVIRELTLRLCVIGQERQWSEARFQKQFVRSRRLIGNVLDGISRVAEFSAYERLFAVWHVVHVPFIYLFLLTAIFHVFAVHAY